MSNFGHNESAVRLAALAGDAQVALDKVARGETDAIDGWLAYGAALNEGRALFAKDADFGKWAAELMTDKLSVTPNDHERAAAMWAAANADQMAESKAACKARTLRGWHDQWKKIEGEREKERLEAERKAERARKAAEAEAARKEAAEQAKAEGEARAAAAAAETDQARQEAEATAAKASEAKAEAEQIVQQAEAESKQTEPEADPEVAKVRRELAKMTPDGVAGTVVELRAALADKKAKRRALKAENDSLKEKLRDHTDDKDEVIRRLQAKAQNADSAKWRATEEQARTMKQVHALKKRVEELEKMGVVTL